MSATPDAPVHSARIYRCWPGFEHNNWVCRRLLDAGLFPDVHFPMRSGRNPRFWIWSYHSADHCRYEIHTDYGRLVESDVERMINIAKHYRNTTTWERRTPVAAESKGA